MYGEALQQARRWNVLSLGAFTANTTVTPTVRWGVPPISNHVGRIRILDLYICGTAIPSDADGTMLLNILNKDISEAADDSLVASQDLETLIVAADKWYALTKATEGAELEFTLEEGDALRATLVNNSAAIDTNVSLSLGIEWIWLTDYNDVAQVPHTSPYIP